MMPFVEMGNKEEETDQTIHLNLRDTTLHDFSQRISYTYILEHEMTVPGGLK